MKLAVIGGGAGSDGCVACGGRRVVETTVGVTGALVIGRRMPTCVDDAGRTERPGLPESDREPSIAHRVNPNGSKRG